MCATLSAVPITGKFIDGLDLLFVEGRGPAGFDDARNFQPPGERKVSIDDGPYTGSQAFTNVLQYPVDGRFS